MTNGGNGMKKRIILVIALLILVVAGAAFIIGSAKDNTDVPFYTTDETVFAIETPYCDLYYPTKWKDKLGTEVIENGDSYSVKFYTTIDGEEISLFDMNFGEEGVPLGTLTNDGEEIPVNIINYDTDFSGYTEEEQSDLVEMVEAINVVISKLLENYEFELI